MEPDKNRTNRKLAWLVRIVIVIVPALAGTLSVYFKAKAEAEIGYQTLKTEVQRQGQALERIEHENSELRNLLFRALFKAPEPRETPAAARVEKKSLEHAWTQSLKPRAPFAQKPLPSNLDMAKEEKAAY